jgi:hypothetical protein
MLSERLQAGAAVGMFSSVLGSTVHRYDHTRPTGDQRHGCSPALLADQDNQFARDDWNLLSIPILFPRKKMLASIPAMSCTSLYEIDIYAVCMFFPQKNILHFLSSTA